MRRVVMPLLAVVASLSLVAACGSGEDSDSKTDSSSASPPSTTPSPTDSSSSAKDSDIVANPPAKTWQDALKAAKQEFSGDVAKIELERQASGGLEYKVELISKDTEYAVQYDADSLNKLSDKRDDLDDDDAEDRKETFDPDSVIDLDKAADAARQQQDGAIREWKIEGKDTGRVQYEFDIRPSGASNDTEVQIDAMDGSVVKDS